jgi:uncharacterized phage protein (TIGR01671 family)
MTKKTKFRLWFPKHGEKGSMHYTETIERILFEDGHYFEWDGPKEYDPFEIMQFTGLKDKNGKEIFEGDILICDGYIGEVRWRVFGWENYMHNSTGWHIIHEDNVIIGNIYQNKDLLK